MATGPTRATLDDLYRAKGKNELIGGRIVQFMAAGHYPAHIAGNIFISLSLFTRNNGRGVVHGATLGYAVPELLSGRESFSPDASYYDGPLPGNPMRFIEGPPTAAFEVRCENDYGTAAEAEMAGKRVDYFTAGTQVVWDVDPMEQIVAVYRRTAPEQPTVFVVGEIVDAEPAVPGWRMSVAEVFGK